MTDHHKQYSVRLLWELQNRSCFYCDKMVNTQPYNYETNKNGYTRDHFFPRSLGFALSGNTVLSCPKCNRKKGSRIPDVNEIIKFYNIWSQFTHPSIVVDLEEFLIYQQLIDFLEPYSNVVVDTRHII